MPEHFPVRAPRDLVDLYVATVIRDRTGRVWAGPDASPLDAPPWHVITAANPDSVVSPNGVNDHANDRLAADLLGRGLQPVAVVGESPDGRWREPSLAVKGLDRSAACELGHRFGQVAIFELSSDDLLVVRCEDALVMASRPRNGPVTASS